MNEISDRVFTDSHSGHARASETIARDSAMRRVLADLDRLARAPRAAVLVRGEPGTGRRHLARRLHDSTFPDGDFITFDRGAPAAKLSELYQGRQARSDWLSGSGSTLFVPELGELDGQAQKLLIELCQKLGEGRLSLRLIASTSQDVGRASRAAQLKNELVHLFPCVVEVPPLRQRPLDVAPLLEHFAVLLAERFECARVHFTPRAIESLSARDWTGNVSELAALVERLTLLADRRSSDVKAPPRDPNTEYEPAFALPPQGIDLATLERQMIEQALELAGQNQTRAATLVGLTRDQLRYRMGKFGLGSRDPRTGT